MNRREALEAEIKNISEVICDECDGIDDRCGDCIEELETLEARLAERLLAEKEFKEWLIEKREIIDGIDVIDVDKKIAELSGDTK